MNGKLSNVGVPFASLVNKGLMPADRELIDSELPFFHKNPFQLGVASGDPRSDSVVLWTRLAPEPLADDGFGGMPDREIPVQWEIATDQNFFEIVDSGTARALPELGHSVHVEVHQLQPKTYYYYRFKVGSELSPVGRTKTVPSADDSIPSLTFALASCQAWYHGYYTAYQYMAEEDLDLVFFQGDYIYEYAINESNLFRQADLSSHHNVKVKTLDQYRLRYALFKSDPDLQKAHAAFPWVTTWDDHEVENNYAADKSQYDATPRQFYQQKSDSYQAFYENLPLRSTSIPYGPNLDLYQKITYGNLAEFNVLDSRQYRDDIVSGDDDERFKPNRSILGYEQEQWLYNNLKTSQARWNVLAQQVPMAQVDRDPSPAKGFNMDKWDGYVANRERVFSSFRENNVRNPVVLSGDIHRHAAANLKADFNDPSSANIGTEFVTSSIASGKDGEVNDEQERTALEENDHLKLYRNQRGYVRCTVTPEEWQTDFLVVPYVTRPGAPLQTLASYVVRDGENTLQELETKTSVDAQNM
ncbi:alkaline phosphatase D family protein [Lentibacillus sp.]|uniref:alkaline phosphatase D family protein n=1 Tax=Lentibacillus sp. TaxID=1925746 RepID=UPI002B4ADF03|nr:alkaline phosphatase D family protein [Lentibacillus sp.]HLS09406.1 alkaline phosphatase D family protein [Lentibacillus sp.]